HALAAAVHLACETTRPWFAARRKHCPDDRRDLPSTGWPATRIGTRGPETEAPGTRRAPFASRASAPDPHGRRARSAGPTSHDGSGHRMELQPASTSGAGIVSPPFGLLGWMDARGRGGGDRSRQRRRRRSARGNVLAGRPKHDPASAARRRITALHHARNLARVWPPPAGALRRARERSEERRVGKK